MTAARKPSAEAARPESRPEDFVAIEAGDCGLGLTELLRAYLDRPGPAGPPASWKHRLVVGLLRRADDGDLKAIQEIWTRLEGKPGAAPPADPELSDLSEAVAFKLLLAANGDGPDDPEDDDCDDDTDDEAPGAHRAGTD